MLVVISVPLTVEQDQTLGITNIQTLLPALRRDLRASHPLIGKESRILVQLLPEAPTHDNTDAQAPQLCALWHRVPWEQMKKFLSCAYEAFMDASNPVQRIEISLLGFAAFNIPLSKSDSRIKRFGRVNAAKDGWNLASVPDAQWTREMKLVPKETKPFDAASSLTSSNWPVADDVCLGGTFDHMHNGHRILLTVAVLLARRRLVCGVTDGSLLANKKRKELVEPLQQRINAVRDFCHVIRPDLAIEFHAIVDMYGPAGTDADLDLLVVSEETKGATPLINEKRSANGIPKMLKPELVELVQSDLHSAEKLSSTQIREWIAHTSTEGAKPPTGQAITVQRVGRTGHIEKSKTQGSRKPRGAAAIIAPVLSQSPEALASGRVLRPRRTSTTQAR
ncbi:hypothetical protein CAOG_005887 [Capsaspora owczarzaki ATCC 30864]|uniref:Cytidyltransferase-like domain-containing protein n=2 Tax=Capsaspora owczarzaki (strain ATCC 30864) TaxID=595528 RepID=A0A0D2VVD5_CAPO3|nr:hypothetical protein CAOG_005887 [Capsaspora owczarzaki ATCC 30864]